MTYSQMLFTASQKQRKTALSYRRDIQKAIDLGREDFADRYAENFDKYWTAAKDLLRRARQERIIERRRAIA